MIKQKPLIEGLFTWPSNEPRLIGSRHRTTGEIRFPAIHRAIPDKDSEEILLERRGKLWTWTIQAFPPKSPPYIREQSMDDFVPFGVGYVELPGQIIVQGLLTVNEPANLRIGMEMELTVVPFHTEPDGTEILMYAFRPTGAKQ